ncbi:hypothetical protein ACJX0J_040382, partial [Zea mays]
MHGCIQFLVSFVQSAHMRFVIYKKDRYYGSECVVASIYIPLLLLFITNGTCLQKIVFSIDAHLRATKNHYYGSECVIYKTIIVIVQLFVRTCLFVREVLICKDIFEGLKHLFLQLLHAERSCSMQYVFGISWS